MFPSPGPAHAGRLLGSAALLRRDELGPSLTGVLVSSAPPAWRDVLDEELGPLVERLMPAALDVLDEGGALTPETLLDVERTGAQLGSRGVPVGLVVHGLEAALACFAGRLREAAGRRRVDGAAALDLLARASVLVLAVVSSLLRGAGDDAATPERPDWWDAATPLAREVLRCASQGLTNGEIAGRLKCSRQAVNYHLRAFMRRLGAPNRTALAVAAHRLGLLDEGPRTPDWSL